jgi:copper resistance protein B
VGTRLESKYEILLTNRLIAETRLELQAFGKDDAELGIGSGLSQLEAGLRVRYEIRREFAPYVGVEWQGKFNDTADFAGDAGEPARDTRFVAGLRCWF